LERPYLARAILLCAAPISFVLRQAALHAVPHVLLQIQLRKYSNISVPRTMRGRHSQADRQSSIKDLNLHIFDGSQPAIHLDPDNFSPFHGLNLKNVVHQPARDVRIYSKTVFNTVKFMYM
jgi:hypothetical protein